MPPRTYAQARYWLLTIPHANFVPYLPPDVAYIKGQLERGDNTDYLHWQVLVVFKSKKRLRAVRDLFGDVHAEPTKSNAANDYVWKEATRVDGTQFDLGTTPFNRNSSTDWGLVRAAAIAGQLDSPDIPADVFVRLVYCVSICSNCFSCYHQLSSIQRDYLRPFAVERECFVFWGPTNTGKSRTAWEQAGPDAYPKVSVFKRLISFRQFLTE